MSVHVATADGIAGIGGVHEWTSGGWRELTDGYQWTGGQWERIWQANPMLRYPVTAEVPGGARQTILTVPAAGPDTLMVAIGDAWSSSSVYNAMVRFNDDTAYAISSSTSRNHRTIATMRSGDVPLTLECESSSSGRSAYFDGAVYTTTRFTSQPVSGRVDANSYVDIASVDVPAGQTWLVAAVLEAVNPSNATNNATYFRVMASGDNGPGVLTSRGNPVPYLIGDGDLFTGPVTVVVQARISGYSPSYYVDGEGAVYTAEVPDTLTS